MKAVLGIALVGAGRIGEKRAQAAADNPHSRLELIADADPARARALARRFSCAWTTDWSQAVSRSEVHAVVVSTPNHLHAPVACAALAAGRHVLVEKPMGRNLEEARRIAAAAARGRALLKVGFNHRYHPAIARARRLLKQGAIGPPLNLRAQYGHGGRPGYEREWRGSRRMAGGGELLDQGIHVVDLAQWFLGPAVQAFAALQTGFWDVAPLEDNAFGFLRFKNGTMAQFHTSWTQWRNLFRFEVFGRDGTLAVDGLGGSYGTESLTVSRVRKRGKPPLSSRAEFPGPDASWREEWKDFLRAVRTGSRFEGRAGEGVQAMAAAAALYRSHFLRRMVSISGGNQK